MIDLGTVKPGSTIRIPFSSFDKDDGSAITMTNYAAADILIYKDGGTTERASTAGFTATTDFDSKTGKHVAIIDLADNTTADFYASGSEYLVAIDSVTIDAVTTGGWIARFRIGYPSAILDTTIATLASQTSFTLTSGPAEDDAINGMWCVIHDAASAIQASWCVILDYTGSTKTVTLAAGATFTVAAKDNISVMFPAPLQPTTTGNKLDVSSGGEAGLDWNNIGSPTTTVNLSGTTVKTATDVETDTADIQGRIPAALVSGRIDASVGAMAANVLTAAAVADGAIDAATFAADVDAEILSYIVDDATRIDASSLNTATVTTVPAIVADTNELQTDWANGGRLDLILDARASQTSVDDIPTNAELATALAAADDAVLAAIAALNNLSAAQVNAEVVDALATDTYAEPGQGSPAATTNIAAKIGYLYKAWRNRTTQTATEYALYADNATTKDQEAAVSDDGTTFERGEVTTGA